MISFSIALSLALSFGAIAISIIAMCERNETWLGRMTEDVPALVIIALTLVVCLSITFGLRWIVNQ